MKEIRREGISKRFVVKREKGVAFQVGVSFWEEERPAGLRRLLHRQFSQTRSVGCNHASDVAIRSLSRYYSLHEFRFLEGA